MITWLASLVAGVFAWLYDNSVSKFLTKATYQAYFASAEPGNSLLDIGVGTGLPLLSVMDRLTEVDIVGLDIDRAYVQAAQQRLAPHPRVRILLQDIMNWEVAKQFSTVLFSFSVMLMPDKAKLFEKVRQLVEPGGKVVFFLTL